MNGVVDKAKKIYYAEGIDSMMYLFEELPISVIEHYIELARKELSKKYVNFKVVK